MMIADQDLVVLKKMQQIFKKKFDFMKYRVN